MATKTSKKKQNSRKNKKNKKVEKTARKKRDTAAYPGLDKRLFSRVKQEYHDIDYADKLNPEDKQWMSDFMTEWLGANLKEGATKMHKRPKQRKRVFDMNNARNRDTISNTRAMGALDSDDVLVDYSRNPALAEQKFVENIDTDQEMLDAFIEVLKDKFKD